MSGSSEPSLVATGDFAREFSEELPALSVGSTLLVLDGAPLRMA